MYVLILAQNRWNVVWRCVASLVFVSSMLHFPTGYQRRHGARIWALWVQFYWHNKCNKSPHLNQNQNHTCHTCPIPLAREWWFDEVLCTNKKEQLVTNRKTKPLHKWRCIHNRSATRAKLQMLAMPAVHSLLCSNQEQNRIFWDILVGEIQG